MPGRCSSTALRPCIADRRVAGLAIDGSGTLVFADVVTGRVRAVALDGTISTVAGNGTDLALGSVDGLTLDSVWRIYVADSTTATVVLIAPGGDADVVLGAGGHAATGDRGGRRHG